MTCEYNTHTIQAYQQLRQHTKHTQTTKAMTLTTTKRHKHNYATIKFSECDEKQPTHLQPFEALQDSHTAARLSHSFPPPG